MRDEHKTREQLVEELVALRRRLREAPAGGAGGDTSATAREPVEYILARMRAMLGEVDEAGRCTYVSPSITDLLGYQPEEVLHRSGLGWVHDEDVAPIGELFAKLVSTGGSGKSIYRARHKNGHWLWLESTGSSYRLPDGSLRVVIFARDVTELKRAGDALRDSEDRFRALAENASDLVAEFDGRGRLLFLGPNARRIFGVDPKSVLGRSLNDTAIFESFHDDDRSRVLAFERTLAAGKDGDIELRFRHGDATWHWLHASAKSYTRGDGLRRVVIARDITERKLTERVLRESEDRYRVVTEATSDLIVELDAEARLIFASPTFESVLGYSPSEIVGTTPVPLLCHPEDIDRLVDVFLEGVKSKHPIRMDSFRLRRRDGLYIWCEGVGLTYHTADDELRLVGVIRDVSARVQAELGRKELEDRMQQAQKLEGLGVMAGGIAHDFNNLLTPILGDTSLALMDLDADSPLRKRLEKVHRAARRAAALTNQLLAYAGRGPLVTEPINLSQLVLEMAQLLESALSQKAMISYEMSADIPAIEGDASQLSQVVMNLITNASEAIGGGSGRVAIRTGQVEGGRIPRSAALFGHEIGEAAYAYFEVEDNGCGMDSATRARIFDPFFTTKFTGRGLGLAAVLGIVRGHRGAIEIESHPARGTRFRVLVPAAGPEVVVAPPVRETATWQCSGTVLVVDDDEGVRDLARVCLERAGLTVLSAGDGHEAVATFRRHAARIDAVLLDCTMPSAGGEEVFEAIRRLREDVPIVVVSGYSRKRAAEKFEGADLAGFLQKPFLPSELVAQVKGALRQR